VLEDLNDDHPAAAARTSVRLVVFVTIFGSVALSARRGWIGYAEELTGQCDIAGPVGVGKQTVVTDAVEAVGQDVDQEAADELIGVERHELVASVALGSVILPFEGYALAVEGDEPTIGNSNPVRVAGKVGEDSGGSAKRRFSILPIIPKLESRFVTPTTRCIFGAATSRSLSTTGSALLG
jgi:hypothetical protein